ncbi:Hypothetical Protein RSKD131_0425 [Cereibacter sphaeroides KD131]|nr:Hypothetical Protein RSKD131_0425 [Cereibacter sphaeroides KD131]
MERPGTSGPFSFADQRVPAGRRRGGLDDVSLLHAVTKSELRRNARHPNSRWQDGLKPST